MRRLYPLIQVLGVEPTLEAPVCQRCTQRQFEESHYTQLASLLGLEGRPYHRKDWEHVYITRCLELAGVMPGRGLGFGIGTDPTIPYMLARGCEIVGTDYFGTSEYWASYHASGKGDFGVSEDDKRLTLEQVDMRSVPSEYHGQFDFVWSACALEHLGGLDAGLQFIRESLKCLRPGGIAVHTTELCVNSVSTTLDKGPLVLYRMRDIEAFCKEVGAPCNLASGNLPYDATSVVPEDTTSPHLNLRVPGTPFITTSIGLVIQA